jgi:hypothetical protein
MRRRFSHMECSRFHGARGDAPKGKANGSYKDGLYTQEAQAERAFLSKLVRESRRCCSNCRASGANAPLAGLEPHTCPHFDGGVFDVRR